MTHKELTKIREEKKLKKGEFAALIGITPMLQGRYEGGKIPIPEHIAEKVRALDAGTAENVEPAEKPAAGAEVIEAAEQVPAVETEAKEAAEQVPAAGAEAKEAAEKAAGTQKIETEKKETEKRETILYVESRLGGTITVKEILDRLPAGTEEVYVKPEENKAYWVKGDQTGDVNLW